MTQSWSSPGWDVHLGWRPEHGRHGLAEAIRAAIRDGRLAPGATVPSTRALAADLGVARGTVTRVYADLRAEGYLRTSQGAPTQVAPVGSAPASAPGASVRPAPARRWTLLPGRPDLSSFPRADWLASTRRVLQHAPATAFGYEEQGGPFALRSALSQYLARSRGVVTDPDRIVVCGGFSHAVAIMSRVLRERGVAEIAFEDPSLPEFRQVAAGNGITVAGVPVDEHGVRVSEIDSPAVVVTPAHQYPTGATLAPSRRTELARWATETGSVVIEDDYDGEFRFDRQQVGALQALAPERVVYVGTASKTLAPGLRIGWLVLPRALVEPARAALTAAGWRPPVLGHLVLADLLDSGAYDRHVRRSRARYRDRRDRLLAALPEPITPWGISAGLQLLLMLPDGVTEERVRAAARARSIEIETLHRAWIAPGTRPQGIVCGYAAPADHAFAPTLDTFLGLLADVLP
ncbi:PLP-dependent aminotransferase family protein [Amycolatopsis minnesotensis]|uniref:PLP-dependent aminotransferase family protein n=1 Tax=Amycolatopsis minnesotensis TaxID=337894 RepID=A0ABN2S7V3_9PSEU